MQCRQCAWFRRPRGRTPTTCRDVGEAPDSEACSQFEVDAPDPTPPDPVGFVGALTRERYSDIFRFDRQTGRLVDLYVLYRLVNAIGLSRYADRIMETEIARVFRDHAEDKRQKRSKVVPL